MIQIGKLDTTVLFEDVTNTQDAMGATVETWAEVSKAPKKAEYMPLKANELVSGGQLAQDTKFKLKIRRNTDISTTCRVTVNSTAYKIMSVQDYQRDNYMILWCGELGD